MAAFIGAAINVPSSQLSVALQENVGVIVAHHGLGCFIESVFVGFNQGHFFSPLHVFLYMYNFILSSGPVFSWL